MFITGLANNIIPAGRLLDWSVQISALGAGGLCSGVVNYWMNVELLEEFYKRMTSNEEKYTRKRTLPSRLPAGWEKFQYFAGIFVFVVTGLLFGLMAFTFAAQGPLALLSIAAGVFVAGIMTIQEVETWLQSWDDWEDEQNEQDKKIEAPLTKLQLLGKWIGHLLAAGNVLALSLLFTLSLAQALMAFQIAAFPALITGFAVAFTFGAFTEYYFYNVYLSDFCKKFGENLGKMLAIPNAWFGFLCVSVNAFVNGALTYTGVELLTGLLLAANMTLPPLAAITALAAISAFFAGSASLILGLAFWIRQHPVRAAAVVPETTVVHLSIVKSRSGLFLAANENMVGSTLHNRSSTGFAEDDEEYSGLECV